MHELNPVNTHDIDEGKLIRAINDHLSLIAKDIVRRPNKVAARKVKVEISIAPSYNDELDVLEAEIDWKVDFAMPGKKGSTSKAAIEDDLLLVNPWDGENPAQTVIDEVVNPAPPETAEVDESESGSADSNVAEFPKQHVEGSQ